MNPSAFTCDKILNNLTWVKQGFFCISKVASLTECAILVPLQITFALALSFSMQQELQEDIE